MKKENGIISENQREKEAQSAKSEFLVSGETEMINREEILEEDQRKLKDMREKLVGQFDWGKFWTNRGTVMPTRADVFPNGEDRGMQDEEVINALNAYLKNKGYDYDNYTGINAQEFPEMIDADIRDLCVELNALPFVKTKEACSGHETYRSTGERYIRGYSEPYLVLYVDSNNSDTDVFLSKAIQGLEGLKNCTLDGVENMKVEYYDEAQAEGVRRYHFAMVIAPTQDWCRRNDRIFVARPEKLHFFPSWCKDNGYAYSDDPESEVRQKWEVAKQDYFEKQTKFEKTYSDYFRSEEVRKMRDAFFQAFKSSVEKK